MEIILIILLVLLVVFIVYVVIETRICNHKIKDYFQRGNVIVYGHKGKGKDVLFQKVIYMRRKEPYLANNSYGYKYIYKDIKTLSVDPNTYENFINGNIVKTNKDNSLEDLDYYLSDGGIFLPCQYDYLLHKKYPSLPIYYALSRHLYNSNIHINTQALSRPWKAIREQADTYIKALGVIKLPFILICKIRFYDKYESAYNDLLPVKARFMNKDSKALVDQYNATHGEIKNMFYIMIKKHIKYDTRHFEKVLFNEKSIERLKK